jgi:hypothetical protein
MKLGTVEGVSGALSCVKFAIARSDSNVRLEDVGRELAN